MFPLHGIALATHAAPNDGAAQIEKQMLENVKSIRAPQLVRIDHVTT